MNRLIRFDNGSWVMDSMAYKFQANTDYTLYRAQRGGCELTGPDFEEAEKVFEIEINKWFMEE